MKEFTTLRAKALQRRNEAITKARSEYAETIAKIFLLEREITGESAAPIRRLNEAVDSVIPAEGEFTVTEIIAALQAMEPGRHWKLRSIHAHLSVLRRRGVIKRIKRCTHDEPAVFCRAGEKSPDEPMTLLETIVSVLDGRAMNLTEITMAVLEAGYRSRMGVKVLRKEVATTMRNDGRFKREKEKWLILR